MLSLCDDFSLFLILLLIGCFYFRFLVSITLRLDKCETGIGRFFDLISLLWNSHQPVEKDSRSDIDDDVNPENSPVPPAVTVRALYGCQEGIGITDGTELAIGSGIRVIQVAARGVDVRSEIFSTCSVERVEVEYLDRRTCDLGVGQSG